MGRVSLMGGFVVGGLAVVALAAAVATLIGAITSDAQSSHSGNCARECVKGVQLTCTFEFEVTKFQTYSWNCRNCQNRSCAGLRGCVEGDGVTRLITAVNQQLPGPPIQVCEGDNIRVLVKNKLLTSGVSFHWHGLTMADSIGARRTPHMDGEPGVTQCPVMPGTKFTYVFPAYPAGTHFWHAQTGLHRGDGVFGSLIVKTSKGSDPNEALYERDLPEHVVMINDWTHIVAEEKFFLYHHGKFSNYPKSILVNGRGPNQGNSILSIPHPVSHKRFSVRSGYRYRFRFINAGFLNCPVTVSVEGHEMTIISSDGSPIKPVNVSSFVIYAGERWDAVIHANRDPDDYWMIFTGHNDCAHDSVYQTAVLEYLIPGRHQNKEADGRRGLSPLPRFNERKPYGKQLNSRAGYCDDEHLCLSGLESAEEASEALKKEEADVIVPLRFRKEFTRDRQSLGSRLPLPSVNGKMFTAPATPVIFQMGTSTRCREDQDQEPEGSLSCFHVIKISLGSVTDLVLVEDGTNMKESVFHLHGHKFYVMGETSRPANLITKTKQNGTDGSKQTLFSSDELDIARKLANSIEKNEKPIQKDTVRIPLNGVIVLRFLADNPGFWMLESQLLFDCQSGMKVVLQVGENHQIAKPPLDFPICGDFS